LILVPTIEPWQIFIAADKALELKVKSEPVFCRDQKISKSVNPESMLFLTRSIHKFPVTESREGEHRGVDAEVTGRV
jgi:hypothetical protein